MSNQVESANKSVIILLVRDQWLHPMGKTQIERNVKQMHEFIYLIFQSIYQTNMISHTDIVHAMLSQSKDVKAIQMAKSSCNLKTIMHCKNSYFPVRMSSGNHTVYYMNYIVV